MTTYRGLDDSEVRFGGDPPDEDWHEEEDVLAERLSQMRIAEQRAAYERIESRCRDALGQWHDGQRIELTITCDESSDDAFEVRLVVVLDDGRRVYLREECHRIDQQDVFAALDETAAGYVMIRGGILVPVRV